MSQPQPANGRGKLWLFSLILVVAAGMFTLVHISNGLHDHILQQRVVLRDLRMKIDELQERNDDLITNLKTDRMKTVKLREKSRVVTEELLGQQQKIKRSQTDLAICRVHFDNLVKNCTMKSRRLGKQFNITMYQLKSHVMENKQLRSLLSKNLEQRTKIELQLENMQITVFNLTQKLRSARLHLKDAATYIRSEKDDVNFLQDSLNTCRKVQSETSQQLQAEHTVAQANQRLLLSEVAKLGGDLTTISNELHKLPDQAAKTGDQNDENQGNNG